MKSVLTGDIVSSRSVSNPEIWLDPLKRVLRKHGDSPEKWEIFRGDSFQALSEPEESLILAFRIKSVIKKQKEADLDVRIAIGLGMNDQEPEKISEATGDAFIRSGRLLEKLKEERRLLGIESPWKPFNDEINMMLMLAMIVMNGWSSNTSEAAELLFQNPDIRQTEMAEKLGIRQSSVHDRIRRGSVYEMLELESYFRMRIRDQISNLL
jgi:hypothetical protein